MSDDNLTGLQNACEPLHTELAVVRQSLARLVINYYWILIALSSLPYLYVILYNVFKGEQLPLVLIIGFSFYPLYILVGALIKSIVQEKIPRSFAQLRATGALESRCNAWYQGSWPN